MALNKVDWPEQRESETLNPGADVTSNTGLRLPADRLGRRLAIGVGASLLINAAAWTLLSQVVHSHITPPLPPITFKRIFLPPPPKPPHKIVHKKPPKPTPKLLPKPIVKPAAKPVPKPQPIHHAPPPAAHHHILTSLVPSAATHTALPGGNAQLGQPIAQQNPGQGTVNNAPPAPTPTPAPTPPPPQPAPKPASVTPPAPKPQPVGLTQDAQATYQELPDIPDDLKSQDYQSSVRVKVEVKADGSASASLLTSSGNMDIDQRVLDALKRWKWKPALQNGQPIDSVQRFRFNFDVH